MTIALKSMGLSFPLSNEAANSATSSFDASSVDAQGLWRTFCTGVVVFHVMPLPGWECRVSVLVPGNIVIAGATCVMSVRVGRGVLTAAIITRCGSESCEGACSHSCRNSTIRWRTLSTDRLALSFLTHVQSHEARSCARASTRCRRAPTLESGSGP